MQLEKKRRKRKEAEEEFLPLLLRNLSRMAQQDALYDAERARIAAFAAVGDFKAAAAALKTLVSFGKSLGAGPAPVQPSQPAPTPPAPSAPASTLPSMQAPVPASHPKLHCRPRPETSLPAPTSPSLKKLRSRAICTENRAHGLAFLEDGPNPAFTASPTFIVRIPPQKQ